jgi:hypothetical protein
MQRSVGVGHRRVLGIFEDSPDPPHNSLVLSDALSCLSPCQVFARLSANERVILEGEEHIGGDQKSEGAEVAKDSTEHELPASLVRVFYEKNLNKVMEQHEK